MRDCSHQCAQAQIADFQCGRAWCWTHSRVTAKILPSGVGMDSGITAFELAALHHELAMDPLRWFAGFLAETHWHSHQQLQV